MTSMKKNVITIIVSVLVIIIVIVGIKFILDTDDVFEPTVVGCEYTDEIKLGSTYKKGDYLYTYIELEDNDKKVYGWDIKYTNPSSKEPTKAPNCATIGGKPLISTKSMYSFAEASLIDISDLNTSQVIDMTGMFEYETAKNIKGLDNLNTKNVKNMSGMFFGTAAITLDLKNFNTVNVINMSSMFEGSEATTINVSSFNTSNVLNMNSMFKNTSVETLDVSSFNISNALRMGQMFAGCPAVIFIGGKYPESEWRTKTERVD